MGRWHLPALPVGSLLRERFALRHFDGKARQREQLVSRDTETNMNDRNMSLIGPNKRAFPEHNSSAVNHKPEGKQQSGRLPLPEPDPWRGH